MAAGLALVACQGPGAPSASPGSRPTDIRALNKPPSAKDVTTAALESSAVSLNTHESCKGAGTDLEDSTIGRYLSGFLVELDPKTGKNGVVTSVEERADGWVCRLMVQRRMGEEVWSWGLEFVFTADGVLDRSSYRCIGAG